MIAGRPVKLFKDGRNRALRVSRDFKFPGEEAIVSKEGDRLIIEPAPAKSLLAVLKGLPTLDEDFPLIGDLAPDPADL
jgi:antitoxin VapB